MEINISNKKMVLGVVLPVFFICDFSFRGMGSVFPKSLTDVYYFSESLWLYRFGGGTGRGIVVSGSGS